MCLSSMSKEPLRGACDIRAKKGQAVVVGPVGICRAAGTFRDILAPTLKTTRI